jgi:hypothetical protein
MKRLYSFAALVLISTSAHAGTFSFEVEGRTVHISAPSGCASLACISVSSPEFHGANYYRGARTKRASKSVSDREDKARAQARTPNSLVKTTNADGTTAAPRSPTLTANNSRPVVVSTEPPAPSIDTPTRPAMVVVTLPAPTDSNAASGPASLAKPMPVDATSDGSASPVNVVVTSPRSSSPSTVESATLITGTIYQPVQTALSAAPAVEYYRRAKENQNRETLDGGRPASLLGNWQTEGKKRSIHIEQCGLFVCGYVADSRNEEKVLIDLKPTSSSEWIGLIVSAESGIMYPSVVILEDAQTLRVRACALGITFCEGQIWTRADPVVAAVH